MKIIYLCTENAKKEKKMKELMELYQYMPIMFVENMDIATDVCVIGHPEDCREQIAAAVKRGLPVFWMDADFSCHALQNQILFRSENEYLEHPELYTDVPKSAGAGYGMGPA